MQEIQTQKNNILSVNNLNFCSNNGLGNEIEIVEVLPNRFDLGNNSLDYFFESVGIRYLDNKTTTKTYYKGDNRSDLDKKYEDYITIYEYLLSSLKDSGIKDELRGIYKPVFERIYGGKLNDSLYEDVHTYEHGNEHEHMEEDIENETIDSKFIRDMFLIKGVYTDFNKCKGYLIRIKKGTNIYGYIYIKEKKKEGYSRNYKMVDVINIFPFVNFNAYKYIGREIEINLDIFLKKSDLFNKKDILEIINRTNDIFSKRDSYVIKKRINYDQDIHKMTKDMITF